MLNTFCQPPRCRKDGKRHGTYSTVAPGGSCNVFIGGGFFGVGTGSASSLVSFVSSLTGSSRVEPSSSEIRIFAQRRIVGTALRTASLSGVINGDKANARAVSPKDAAIPHAELAGVTNQAITAPKMAVTKFRIDGWLVRRERRMRINTANGKYWLKFSDISIGGW